MAQPLNPQHPVDGGSPTAQSPSPASRLYQQGVVAFKRADYQQALALFQQTSQLGQAAPADRLKAEMGIVQAHRQLGQDAVARQRCEDMLSSPSSALRQWARQTLAKLPPVPGPETLGQPVSPVSSEAWSSGVIDQSGFVPLGVDDQPEPSTPVPSLESRPENNDLPQPPSLFQYQRLNQQSLESPGQDQAPLPDLPQASIAPLAGQPDLTPEQGSVTTTPPSASQRSASVPPRSQRRPARPTNLFQLWLMELVTAIMALLVISWGLHLGLKAVNGLLRFVQWPIRLGGIAAFDRFPLGLVLVLALGLTLTSPWLMDWGLARWHRQRPLATRQLQALRPGALQFLRRVCRQQGWQLPQLRLIPDPAPLCFSYGWHPRNTRLVISQGLLDNLSEDHLTALYSYELAHLANGDLPLMSAMGVVLLIFDTAYRQLASWGDRLSPGAGRVGVGILASGFYGIFWLLRQLVLWFSRVRSEWCDRRATTWLQNPLTLPEALLHLTIAIGSHGHQRGTLHPLLTCLDVLMPISSQPALSPGSFLPRVGLPQLMAEDQANPYRHWLMANASHPLIADRLQGVSQTTALGRESAIASDLTFPDHVNLQPLENRVSLPLLLLQKAPLAGLLAGASTALGLWLMGRIFDQFGWQRLGWFYQDPSLLWGGMWLGLGLGLMMRINALYPDIKTQQHPAASGAATLLTGPVTLPVEGQPVVLRGKLLGPTGLVNGLCQVLYLDDQEGLVKLEVPFSFSHLPTLKQANRHPADWIGRIVTVSGWKRRGGGLLWLDVDEIRLEQSRKFCSQSPIWMTLLSLGLSFLGIITILRGG